MIGIAAEQRSFVGSPSVISEMLARLQHRDTRRAVIEPGSLVTLGSVGSLAPLVGANGSALVFDGRLDDRERLMIFAQIREPATDPELLLTALERRGLEATLARLRGDYAFAWYDARSECLVAARDRIGVKPLFWASADGRLVMGSEPHAVLAGGTPELSLQALALALVEEAGPVGSTMFRGLCSLPPGHLLIANRHGHRVKAYGSFIPSQLVEADDVESASRLLDGALATAVRDRLRHDGRVAILMSGGLDSTTIAALAKEEAVRMGAPAPLIVSTRYGGFPCDESGYVELTAKALELELHHLDLPTDPSAYREPAVRDLLLDPSHVLLADAARWGRSHGANVQLTGIGSDELQGATGFECDVALRAGEFRLALALAARSSLPSTRVTGGRLFRALGRRLYTSAVRERLGKPRWGEPSWLPDWATPRAVELIREGRARRRETERHLHHPCPMQETVYRELGNGTQGPRFFEQIEFGAAAAGVDLRHPFLDTRVVELILSLPPQLRASASLSKPVLRQAARRRLPREITERKSPTSFDTFFQHALLASGVAARALAGGALEALGLVRRGSLRSLLDSAKGPAGLPHVRSVLVLAGLELWLVGYGLAPGSGASRGCP